MTPRLMENTICTINMGNIARYTQPGKLPLISKNAVNSPKMMAKFSNALETIMIGRVRRGKLIFFNRLALSINIFWARPTTSAKRPQVRIPAHRQIL